MVTIIEAIGENYEKVLLKDNESLYGGKIHSEETLGEFMYECEIEPTEDYGELCVKLEQYGLKAIRPIKHINQEDRENANLPVYDLLTEW